MVFSVSLETSQFMHEGHWCPFVQALQTAFNRATSAQRHQLRRELADKHTSDRAVDVKRAMLHCGPGRMSLFLC